VVISLEEHTKNLLRQLVESGILGAMRPRPKPRSIAEILRAFETDLVERLEIAETERPRQMRAVRAFVAEQHVKTLADFTSAKCVAWLMTHVRKGDAGSKKTALNMRSRLRRFSQFLLVEGLIAADPLDGLRLPRAAKRKGAHPFTAKEVSGLIVVAERREDTKDGRTKKYGPLASSFYGFLAMTGLRFREARLQRWEDIDLPRRTMIVTSDKARRRDALPLTKECVALLKIWRRYSQGEKVFPHVPSHHTLVADMEAAGIPRDDKAKRGQWHRLRKCAITERALAGADAAALTKFARHTNEDTTRQFYDIRESEQLRAVAELMPRLNGFQGKVLDPGARTVDTHAATNATPQAHSDQRRKSRVPGSPPACGLGRARSVDRVGEPGTRDFRRGSLGKSSVMEPGGIEPPGLTPDDSPSDLLARVTEAHTAYLRMVSGLMGRVVEDVQGRVGHYA
jgi:integrase